MQGSCGHWYVGPGLQQGNRRDYGLGRRILHEPRRRTVAQIRSGSILGCAIVLWLQTSTSLV
jgi:hypothetical protein